MPRAIAVSLPLAVTVFFSLSTAAYAGPYSDVFFDRFWTEPRFALRADAGQADASEFSAGPEAGYRLGLGNENLFSAVDATTGFLIGFPSLAYPIYLGLDVGGRLKESSPYAVSLGIGEEAILKARTPEAATVPFHIKVRLEGELFRSDGSSIGAYLAYSSISETFPTVTKTYSVFSLTVFMAWPSNTGLDK